LLGAAFFVRGARDRSVAEAVEELNMSRPAGWIWIVVAGSVTVLAANLVTATAGEDPRTAQTFLEQLREHGLHELALDYIKVLRADSALPPKVTLTLDYEEGRTLIDEAAKSGDLVLRDDLLKDAREKLEGFVKANPSLPETRKALVDLAKLLIERGHLAMLLSEEATDKGKKEAKVAEARAAFSEAHEAYTKALDPLSAAYKKYAGFIPDDDPRKAERDGIYAALLDAMLQKGVADYELAQTFPPGSPERAKSLKEALGQFETLYKSYRTQFAGLAAQMYQAKCYEENGDVNSAMGIYKQLMEHGDARLRGLQRNVGYFYIVALSKRKQYALAADEAARWLATYNRRDERRSPEGLGVLMELAKDIDAQMGEVTSNERPRAVGRIVDAVSQIVRYASPFKKEAMALLRKYKPSAAVRAEDIAKLTYEDLVGQADEAIASHEWERAITLLNAAIRKADPTKNIDKANMARYNLAFCYYMNKQFYESAVLAEHYARRYPQGGQAAKSTEIGMQSWADAYSAYGDIDRRSDLNHLIDLAKYTAEAWPDKEQGDGARINLGQIYLGMGQYDKAIEILGSVRQRSRDWPSAQNRLGSAHWAKSRDLDRRGDATGAQAEGQKAIDVLNIALKARRDANVGPTDPGLVGNVGDLATVLTETGKPADALKLLDPVIKVQTVKTGAGYARLIEAQLKAYITSGSVEQAIASMKVLEQSGDASGRAQLYYKLGKLLEKELESLKEKKNTAALTRMHQAYKTFLTTLAESKTGQSYESLQWAGEGLLTLDAYADAEKVLRRVLTEFTADPQFLQQQGGNGKLFRTKLRLITALRGAGKFGEANTILEELLKQKPPYLETLIEQGMLLESEAAAGKSTWSSALRHWEDLTKRMERMRPRPVSYYDAWYHVAWVLYQKKEPEKAKQALMGVMRLSPNVGGADMKAKYQGLIAKLK
jgi:cellulose synthase operon protein C